MSTGALGIIDRVHVRVGNRSREFRAIGSSWGELRVRKTVARGVHDAPQVSSPLTFIVVVVGSKETETSSAVIMPRLERLSVTVGISWFGELVRVPEELGQPNGWKA